MSGVSPSNATRDRQGGNGEERWRNEKRAVGRKRDGRTRGAHRFQEPWGRSFREKMRYAIKHAPGPGKKKKDVVGHFSST